MERYKLKAGCWLFRCCWIDKVLYFVGDQWKRGFRLLFPMPFYSGRVSIICFYKKFCSIVYKELILLRYFHENGFFKVLSVFLPPSVNLFTFFFISVSFFPLNAICSFHSFFFFCTKRHHCFFRLKYSQIKLQIWFDFLLSFFMLLRKSPCLCRCLFKCLWNKNVDCAIDIDISTNYQLSVHQSSDQYWRALNTPEYLK